MALDALAMDLTLDEHRSARLIPFTRTELAGELPKVSRAVLAQGEVIITAHNKPEMVLMTVERYLQLQEAGRPNLDKLGQDFDELFSVMQGPQAHQAALAAFSFGGEELGKAAVAAARAAG